MMAAAAASSGLHRLARRDGDGGGVACSHRRRDRDVAHLGPLHRGLLLFFLVLADAAPRWRKKA